MIASGRSLRRGSAAFTATLRTLRQDVGVSRCLLRTRMLVNDLSVSDVLEFV
jgi:hypothetical protein